MRRLAEKGLTGKGMEFYLEGFTLGAPPHGGFDLGLSGAKEATFHPDPGRLTP